MDGRVSENRDYALAAQCDNTYQERISWVTGVSSSARRDETVHASTRYLHSAKVHLARCQNAPVGRQSCVR